MIQTNPDLYQQIKNDSQSNLKQSSIQFSQAKDAPVSTNTTEAISKRNTVYKSKDELAPQTMEDKNLSIELKALLGKPSEDNQLFIVNKDGLSVSVLKNFSDLVEKCIVSEMQIIDLVAKLGCIYILTQQSLSIRHSGSFEEIKSISLN